MTKKFLSLSCGAALAMMAFSATADAQNRTQNPRGDMYVSDRSGVYLGGYGGYGWTDADVSGGGSADLSGGDYGLFVGYQLDGMFRNMNMGINGSIEAHYGWSEADDRVTVAGVPIDVSKENEWGISFRPGLTFIDEAVAPVGIKPYGIIGYRQTELEASGAGATGDETFHGFELGIGTELIAFNDFGVRLDYSHVWYGEESGIDPDEDNLRLGLAYHF
jgi:outer membrane immunogenic protein